MTGVQAQAYNSNSSESNSPGEHSESPERLVNGKDCQGTWKDDDGMPGKRGKEPLQARMLLEPGVDSVSAARCVTTQQQREQQQQHPHIQQAGTPGGSVGNLET